MMPTRTVQFLTFVGLILMVEGNKVNKAPQCDVGYECEFFVKEKGSDSKNPKFWMFNFNGLCAPNDYEADSIKKSDGIVQFNICGKSNDYCLPKGNKVPYIYGVAIQYWGDAPDGDYCDVPGSDEKKLCTKNCEVIGIGQPSFELMDETDPAKGGVKLAHRAAIAAKDDQWECHKDGLALERHATYEIECDPSVDLVEVDGAEEQPECHYRVKMRSKHACGKEVTYSASGDNNSGSSSSSGAGIGTGMFFFGAIMCVVLIGGYWYWTKRRSSGYTTFGSSSTAGAKAQGDGVRSTGTGGIGSSSL